MWMAWDYVLIAGEGLQGGLQGGIAGKGLLGYKYKIASGLESIAKRQSSY